LYTFNLGLLVVPEIFFLTLLCLAFLLTLLTNIFHSLLCSCLTNLTSNYFITISDTFAFVRFWFSQISNCCSIVPYLLLVCAFYNDLSIRWYFYFYTFRIF